MLNFYTLNACQVWHKTANVPFLYSMKVLFKISMFWKNTRKRLHVNYSHLLISFAVLKLITQALTFIACGSQHAIMVCSNNLCQKITILRNCSKRQGKLTKAAHNSSQYCCFHETMLLSTLS